MDQHGVWIFSQDIFRAFRDQQKATHGNTGCRCDNCLDDMHQAVQKVIEERNFQIEEKKGPPQSLFAASVLNDISWLTEGQKKKLELVAKSA